MKAGKLLHFARIGKREMPLRAVMILTLFLGSAAAATEPTEEQMRRLHQLRPASDPGKWIKDSDRPSPGMGGERGGITIFRLDIDQKGRAIKCTIVDSSGSPILDSKTCEVMLERARFKVPKAKKGEPWDATWFSRVRWQPLSR